MEEHIFLNRIITIVLFIYLFFITLLVSQIWGKRKYGLVWSPWAKQFHCIIVTKFHLDQCFPTLLLEAYSSTYFRCFSA